MNQERRASAPSAWTDSRFWDKIADKYSRKPVELPEAFDRKIAITKDCMSPGDVVLDVGCGTGTLALRLAETGAHMHGLDLSGEMIRIARAKPAPSQGRAAFHCGPFDDTFTEFADGSLDGICAYSILHLVEDTDAALQKMVRLLKPGGFFVSSTPCLGESRMPFGMIIGAMRLVGKAPKVQVISRARLDSAMRAAGLVEISEPDVGAGPNTAFHVASKAR